MARENFIPDEELKNQQHPVRSSVRGTSAKIGMSHCYMGLVGARTKFSVGTVPWCGWHGFRRGLATNLYELGVEAKTRQAILRHADVSVTEKHYVKPVSEVSAAAMRTFQGVLKAKMKARAVQRKAPSK